MNLFAETHGTSNGLDDFTFEGYRNGGGDGLIIGGLNGRSSESGAGRARGRLHVEKHMFDVARFVETHQTLGERFDLFF
ncbi:MAG: hypothetical protein JOZ32_06515 [Bryobacterales bacterium]|nr:hypothetical protein [Bryobacterales bacterium]